ncbi:MAG: DNA-3-methyladenine glycosylase [Chloroflexota bacterium]|nr:DNA-3-methyladenine glycosylase [Chloroflexota bacterium]
MTARLSRPFYARPTLRVARDLLGATLVRVDDQGVRRSGRIVETEAYVGAGDAASHARSGPAGRAAVMWGEPGVAYVYLIYGLHHCFNAVTEPEGKPGAVLVRAIEPVANASRGHGPALVCSALGIDRALSGTDLVTSDVLFLEHGQPVTDGHVRVGPRIGVEYAGDWASRPFRFWVADSPHVSRRGVAGSALNPAMLG